MSKAHDLTVPSARERTDTSLFIVWQGGAMTVDLPPTGSVTIGRGDGCDVRIDHPSVSRVHARLHIAELRVEDLNSSNGTRVGGHGVPPGGTSSFTVGAQIELGDVHVVMRAAEPAAVFEDVVVDPAMQKIHDLVDVVAKSTVSVVLLGETGVGKEVMAARIHKRSGRANAPYVKLNCAALAESLLEAELFGHERGAFTGAVQAKPGLIETAHGGTLFLDEIGEMPLGTQAKLLRMLESGEVTRIGAVKPRNVDVRVVSATNRNLRALVDEGRFRGDLFFRIDGLTIVIPPLRQRASEIASLAALWAERAARGIGKPTPALAPSAIARLESHSWPGNIRELKNVITRSVLLATAPSLEGSDLRFEDFGSAASSQPAPLTNPSILASATMPPAPMPTVRDVANAGNVARSPEEERRRVVEVLEQCGGNQTRAAEVLGMSRRTLVYRLQEYGLTKPRK